MEALESECPPAALIFKPCLYNPACHLASFIDHQKSHFSKVLFLNLANKVLEGKQSDQMGLCSGLKD